MPSPQIRSQAMRVFPDKGNRAEFHAKNFLRRRVIHRSCGEKSASAHLASMNNSGIAISPRRQPWEKMCHRPARGDRILAHENFLSPLCGFRFPIRQPTADAVGYLLPLLRSYLPPLSKAHLRTDANRATRSKVWSAATHCLINETAWQVNGSPVSKSLLLTMRFRF